jgi:hypothetical protein
MIKNINPLKFLSPNDIDSFMNLADDKKAIQMFESKLIIYREAFKSNRIRDLVEKILIK